MKCGFNTGRFYNEIGQPITAEKVGDVIVFFDHARGIEGEIPILNPHLFDTQGELARHVIYMYDRGQFKYVSCVNEAAYKSMRDQQRLGYDEWMKTHDLTPIQRFMLS